MTTLQKRNALRPLLLGALAGLIGLGASLAVSAAEIESEIARGGRLYDRFYKENRKVKPPVPHAAYPNKDGKYAKDSWRCKECHGWDYKGKDGAYASGGHATGIKGINAAAGKEPAEIIALLTGPSHGYTEKELSADDLHALALFVSKGQIDMSRFIADKKAKGDPARGEVYFNTICAGCHGKDGKLLDPPLGSVAGNPHEMLHKVLNGQPGQEMPALRALDPQIAVDIVSYLPQLPKQ